MYETFPPSPTPLSPKTRKKPFFLVLFPPSVSAAGAKGRPGYKWPDRRRETIIVRYQVYLRPRQRALPAGHRERKAIVFHPFYFPFFSTGRIVKCPRVPSPKWGKERKWKISALFRIFLPFAAHNDWPQDFEELGKRSRKYRLGFFLLFFREFFAREKWGLRKRYEVGKTAFFLSSLFEERNGAGKKGNWDKDSAFRDFLLLFFESRVSFRLGASLLFCTS